MSLAFLESEVERLALKASVYGPETLWKQNEFSEILPFPKPLSLSVLRRLAGHNGATGAVCRELGLSYNSRVPIEDYLETIFGRTFINSSAEEMLIGGKSGKSLIKNIISSAKLQQGIRVFYRGFRDVISEIDAYHERHRNDDLKKLTVTELLEKINDLCEALNDHYRYVVKAGLFANFSLDELSAAIGKEEAVHLLTSDSRSVLNGDKDALDLYTFREKELAAFFRYSADIEYELACPRFVEEKRKAPSARSKSIELPDLSKIAKKAKTLLFFFKVYESLKVICKTMLLRELYLLRLAVLEYDKRCGLKGDIFYLTLDELFSGRGKEFINMIEERKRKEEVFRVVELPTSLVFSELSALIHGNLKRASHTLKGVSVNGLDFEGRAIIYNSEKDLEKAEDDSIIVARYASPNLVMAFSRARGIITETGGLLSHLAIVAREQGFPLVLQVQDAASIIKSGNILSVSDTGLVRIVE